MPSARPIIPHGVSAGARPFGRSEKIFHQGEKFSLEAVKEFSAPTRIENRSSPNGSRA